MTAHITTRNEIAMNKLAEYMGKNARMLELDQKLMNGGSLTTAETDEVIRFFSWDNMSVGS